MAVLALYTNSFPYGNAETFLEYEIKYLALHFEKIYIIPFIKSGLAREVPENIKVLPPIQVKMWSAFNIYLRGMFNIFRLFGVPELKKEFSGSPLLKSLRYLGFGILTEERLSIILAVDPDIHYTYWLGFSTFALAMLKKKGKIKTLVSRAHGYDLYEERGEKGLAFIKPATLKYVDKVFFISDHGRRYLLRKFPEYSGKFFLSRLGTTDPEFTNPLPDTNSLTILSCSAINPNKRINLIFDSLIILKGKHPAIKVTWHHIGSGKELSSYIEKAAASFLNSYINCYFHGLLPNNEVFEFYKSVGLDLLINVSENEGLPVSIMEAQSFSVPVAATDVGGTAEIVNNDNGFLLNPRLLPDDLTDTLIRIYENRDSWIIKRDISRASWEQNFNAQKNYSDFAANLLKATRRN